MSVTLVCTCYAHIIITVAMVTLLSGFRHCGIVIMGLVTWIFFFCFSQSQPVHWTAHSRVPFAFLTSGTLPSCVSEFQGNGDAPRDACFEATRHAVRHSCTSGHVPPEPTVAHPVAPPERVPGGCHPPSRQQCQHQGWVDLSGGRLLGVTRVEWWMCSNVSTNVAVAIFILQWNVCRNV
jgi:hypothetical protein